MVKKYYKAAVLSTYTGHGSKERYFDIVIFTAESIENFIVDFMTADIERIADQEIVAFKEISFHEYYKCAKEKFLVINNFDKIRIGSNQQKHAVDRPTVVKMKTAGYTIVDEMVSEES